MATLATESSSALEGGARPKQYKILLKSKNLFYISIIIMLHESSLSHKNSKLEKVLYRKVSIPHQQGWDYGARQTLTLDLNAARSVISFHGFTAKQNTSFTKSQSMLAVSP